MTDLLFEVDLGPVNGFQTLLIELGVIQLVPLELLVVLAEGVKGQIIQI